VTGDRLRVLVVQAYGEHGGSESWLLRLLDATDRLDVEVLLLKDGPLREQLRERGVPVTVESVGRQPWSIGRPVARLARRLRRERPDVVLGNVLKAQLVAAPAGLLTGTPTVWAKHDHGYDRLLARPLGRMSDSVVGAVEELAAPTGRADAVVIPPPRPEQPPASREQARRVLAERGLHLPEDVPVVAMAGRLVPFKGVDDALAALALPAAAEWHLAVVGDDDHSAPGETERLRALAVELGVADRVSFAGHVPGVASLLAAFDALAVLTRRGGRRDPVGEGFGTVAFEAMLAGVPVVAVSGGAVVRRLEGEAGIGVPASDPSAVAAALARLRDPQVRARAGAAGRALTADHPDAEQCANMLVEVLEGAARRGSRARRRRAPVMQAGGRQA
jgi:glycosyltransferase involved in cell wall biosynthesis